MANLIITSTANLIIIDFGILSSLFGRRYGTYSKSKVTSIELDVDNEFVNLGILEEKSFAISFDGLVGLKVDSINGVSPTSNLDLFNKLTTLLG